MFEDSSLELGTLEAAKNGPYGIPIFSPDEIALMRSSLEFIRSLPPVLQMVALSSAFGLAWLYGLKPKRPQNETGEQQGPEL